MNGSAQHSTAPDARELRRWLAAALLAVCGILSGCSTVAPQAGRGFEDPNVYKSAPALPADVRRVAVLPLAADDRYSDLAKGCEAFDPVLNAELIKTKKFEVVSVAPAVLQDCVGRVGWTGSEVLPPELLASLHETYGCDAILFCQLTEYRAYAPLAIGWRMKLVNVRTRQILWAGDELFDAREQPAPDRSHLFWLFPRSWIDKSTEGWEMETSPRRFARYTVARLLTTLPER
jgi:hypothetical protein